MNRFVATIAGIAAMIVTILIVETAAHALFPTQASAGGDPAGIVAAMPDAAKAMVMLGWFLGPLAGTAVAARLTAWRPAPWIAAGLAVASGLATVIMIPHPLLMTIGAALLPVAALWLGVRLGSRTRTTP